MFRAVRFSSSGGQIVLLQPLVSPLCVNGRTVCRLRAFRSQPAYWWSKNYGRHGKARPHRDLIPGPFSPVAGNLLGNEARPHILSNPSVQYRSHKSLSEAPLLRHINPVQLLISNFCNTRFNIIAPTRSYHPTNPFCLTSVHFPCHPYAMSSHELIPQIP